MIKISQGEYDDLIVKAFEAIPLDFRSRLDNVLIAAATHEEERRTSNLFGLYTGVSEPNNLGNYLCKITLWQSTMEVHCNTIEELSELVRTTLWHEIGHHFGMDETEVRNASYKPKD